ncbi:unnamed protein product [Boreogadus saida]
MSAVLCPIDGPKRQGDEPEVLPMCRLLAGDHNSSLAKLSNRCELNVLFLPCIGLPLLLLLLLLLLSLDGSGDA